MPNSRLYKHAHIQPLLLARDNPWFSYKTCACQPLFFLHLSRKPHTCRAVVETQSYPCTESKPQVPRWPAGVGRATNNAIPTDYMSLISLGDAKSLRCPPPPAEPQLALALAWVMCYKLVFTE